MCITYDTDVTVYIIIKIPLILINSPDRPRHDPVTSHTYRYHMQTDSWANLINYQELNRREKMIHKYFEKEMVMKINQYRWYSLS